MGFCVPNHSEQVFNILRHNFHRFVAIPNWQKNTEWFSKKLVWLCKKPENFKFPEMKDCGFLGFTLVHILSMLID